MKELCPDCSVELIKNKKRLGREFPSWYVCPLCGYRTKEKSIREEWEEIDRFYEYKNRVNGEETDLFTQEDSI